MTCRNASRLHGAVLECLGQSCLGNCVYLFDLISTAGQGCTVHVPSLYSPCYFIHITGRKLVCWNELGGGGVRVKKTDRERERVLCLFAQGLTYTVGMLIRAPQL